jgi:excisionase family DNA binding protein
MKYAESTSPTTATNEFPEIMIRSEAARFLRMSERHFRTLVHEGRVPEIRAGRRKRLYRKSALLRALEEGQG